MSTKLNKKQFIEALRKLIRKEIEEASTTASAGGNQGQGIHYDTPKAFASGSDEEKGHPTDGEVGGYTKAEQVNEVMFAVKISKDGSELQTIVGASSKGQAKTKVARMLKGGMKDIIGVSRIQPAFGKQIDKKIENVNEGRYHDWKRDESLTPRQKIGRSIREVRHSLSELDRVVKMAVKLKTELNMDSRSYWKNTHKALTKISERLVKMANKVGNLK